MVLDNAGELSFAKEGAVWHVQMPEQKKAFVRQVTVFFSGTPHEAIRAPWDGGWTFIQDSLGRPRMTVTCQGLGASVWYPCKDHQSDEPGKGIRNDHPIIAKYGVNNPGSGDMYPKSGNMLHAICHSINNDVLFRKIMRGLISIFCHQTVTTEQVEDYVSKQAGYDYSKVFDQYLRTVQIPKLEFYLSANNTKVFYY